MIFFCLFEKEKDKKPGLKRKENTTNLIENIISQEKKKNSWKNFTIPKFVWFGIFFESIGVFVDSFEVDSLNNVKGLPNKESINFVKEQNLKRGIYKNN
jgi:hypothetical protein